MTTLILNFPMMPLSFILAPSPYPLFKEPDSKKLFPVYGPKHLLPIFCLHLSLLPAQSHLLCIFPSLSFYFHIIVPNGPPERLQ